MKSLSDSASSISLQIVLGLALLAGLDPGHARAADADNPPPLAFKGAQIGMSLQEWRAVPIPPGAGNAPERQCSNEYQVAKLPGVELGADEVKAGVVACTYVQRFGHNVLPESIELDPGFEAQNLTYLFKHGRLYEIRFKASVDAYTHLQSNLTERYGQPVQTVSSPAVASSANGQRRRQTWRAAAGFVTLEDPSASLPTLLSVRYFAATHRPRYGPILEAGARRRP